MNSLRCMALLSMLLLGLTLTVSQVVYAATFDVPAGDVGQLITAINTSNGNGEADVINLAPGSTYTLTAVDNDTDGPNGLPSITSEIAVNGNGATIECSCACRVFHADSGASLSLDSLTVTNGHLMGVCTTPWAGSAKGGGLYCYDAAVTLTDCTFVGNQARGGDAFGVIGPLRGGDAYGGGIYALDVTLSLTNCTFTNNDAIGGDASNGAPVYPNDAAVGGNAYGGGICIRGAFSTTNWTDCVFSSNNGIGGEASCSFLGCPWGIIQGIDFGGGGSLWDCPTTLTGCVFDLNSPGPLRSYELTASITDSEFARNQGGLEFEVSTVSMTNCTISKNTAVCDGGAINTLGDGAVSLTNCTISTNMSGVDGGGVNNSGDGAISLTNCTITGNTSVCHGGGVNNLGDGAITLTNCTLSANEAGEYGGGICNYWDGVVTLINCTITDNKADDGGDGGGVYQYSPGAGTTNVYDTIIAANTVGVIWKDLCGPFSSSGYNLIGNGSGSTGFVDGVNGDQVGSTGDPIDPVLGPLQDNGGPTQTHMLLTGSPCIDMGDPAFAPPPDTDQRGVGYPRVVNGRIDIGAVEAPHPGVHLSSTSVNVTEGGTTDSYYVVLTSEPSDTVTITVDPDGQTDVGAGADNSIGLYFDDATWHSPQTVTVTAFDDAVAEGPHTGVINHTASSGDADHDGIAIDDVTAYITDNDTPRVSGLDPLAGLTITTRDIDIDVTFSEEVFAVDATDMELSGSAAAGASVGAPTNTVGDTWRFPVMGLASGVLEIDLAPDPDDIEDVDGNDLDPSPTQWGYTVNLPASFDFGDAPDPMYPTLMVNGGAHHVLGSGLCLGTRVDGEPDGQPDPNAEGDDLNDSDDEDGVTFITPLAAGRTATVEVVASAPGKLDVWIDFNRHADLDVVVGNFLHRRNRLYLNNGTAAPFDGVSGTDITTDTHSTAAIVAGDVDGDGDLDVAAGSYDGQRNRLYLNNGTADPFSGVTGTDITTDGHWTRAMALGDVDRDGDLDIVAGNRVECNRLYLNNGTGDPFSGVTGTDVTTAEYETDALALADLDGDGDLDVVTGNWRERNRCYLNNGTDDPFNGIVGADISTDAHRSYAVDLGDVDGDGDIDLVVASWGERNRCYLNNGTADPFNGISGANISTDEHKTMGIALGDVDGDGDLDLAAGNYEGQRNRLYLNNGTADPFNGVIGTDITSDTHDTRDIALGDVDGDGDLDMVAGNGSSSGVQNRLYINNGDGTAWTGTDITADEQQTDTICLGDVDGDGAWADPGEQVFTSEDLVAGDNSLTFTVPATAVLGDMFARFRFSSAGGLSFKGRAPDGEVEDYQVMLELAAPMLEAEPPFTVGDSNTLDWSAVAQTDEYYVELDDDPNFGSPDGDSGWIADLSHEFTALTDGETYYYHVKARITASGTESAWSNAEFSTQDASPPGTGTVTSDAGMYTNDNTHLDFSWSGFDDPGSGIADYEVALGDGTDPEAYESFTSVGLVPSHSFTSGPYADETYVCTVRAVNGVGLTTGASADVTVDTSPPTAGTVTSDAGAHTDDSAHLDFSWSGFEDPGSGIADYEVALGDGTDPEAYESFTSVGIVARHSFTSGPYADERYVCTVRAISGSGLTTDASASVTVDTNAPAAAITPLSPSPTGADSVDFEVAFSEPVAPTFTTADVANTGNLGVAATFGITGADPRYTVTVTPIDPNADGTIGIVIGIDVTDAAGNPYAGGSSALCEIFNWFGFTTEPEDEVRLYVGDCHTFRVVADCGSPTLAYQWWFDNDAKTAAAVENTDTLQVGPVTSGDAGDYWCDVTYDGATYWSNTATLYVKDHLLITSQPQGGDKTEGESHTFTVETTGGYNPLEYTWKKDGIALSNDAVYIIASLEQSDSGAYTVGITDANFEVVQSNPAVLTVTSGLPTACAAGLAVLVGVCALGGVAILRRKQ